MRFLLILALTMACLACTDTLPEPVGNASKAPVLSSDLHVAAQNFTCAEPTWGLPACTTGTTTTPKLEPESHVALPQPITYADAPPSSGEHRPDWAKWGEYKYLPPQTWIHNLEHGGVALLYHPCTPAVEIEALRQFARARKPDAGGAFRWLLTPYPGLHSPVVAVTWGGKYAAACVRPDELEAFLVQHYRKAPEDVGAQGGYGIDWIGK